MSDEVTNKIEGAAGAVEVALKTAETVAVLVPGGQGAAVALGLAEKGVELVKENAGAIAEGLETVEHLAEDITGRDLDGDGTVG